jgi:hypothetical protein
MKFYTSWIIIVCFFSALVAGFFILKNTSSGTSVSEGLTLKDASTTSLSFASSGLSPVVPAGYKEYRNTDYGFSVYYPPENSPQEFPDRDRAFTVLFQGAAGEPGFQIYVAPIKGTQITPERFSADEPSGVKQEPDDTVIDGVPAITFFGFDARLGKTREVWFIHNLLLFEVTTYKELDSWLSDIMKTWRFI